MALVVADRVQENASAPGTGTLSLGGATAGYQTFVSGIGSGNTTYYTIVDVTANTWEVGLGTVTSGSPDSLSRDTILSNSSGNTSPINFANAVTAWCDYPAGKAVYKAVDDSVIAPEFAASNGLLLNNATVGTSYSVPSGYNAVSAGPVAVASGVTVTLPSGSNWVVV